VPYVYFREQPTGPNAGKMLQPEMELPKPVMTADGEQSQAATKQAPTDKQSEKESVQHRANYRTVPEER
jgi:hypothetical protein